MKKIVSLLLLLALSFSTFSCSGSSAPEPEKSNSESSEPETEEETEEETEAETEEETGEEATGLVPYEFTAVSFDIPKEWEADTSLSPMCVFSNSEGVTMTCQEKDNPYPGDLEKFLDYIQELRSTHCEDVMQSGMAGDIQTVLSCDERNYYLDFEVGDYWYHIEFDVNLFHEPVAPVLRSITIKDGYSQ